MGRFGGNGSSPEGRAIALIAEPQTSEYGAERFIGRVRELRSLEGLLERLDSGRRGSLVIYGEPGIGKTRLLAELRALADRRGHLVLYGSASELERDLPFSVFVDALDEYLGSFAAEQLAPLGEGAQTELGQVFPSLAESSVGRTVAVQQERYRTHRAVRLLLEQLARARPVVLALDDFHWADMGSVELLGALLRHPPASVLLAVAVRPRQVQERLTSALERAHRVDGLGRMVLDGLSADEARELLGPALGGAELSALHGETGGNPFYMEQLARASDRAGNSAPAADGSLVRMGVPAAVAGALDEELRMLSPAARVLLQGAAVAGDPFEPELAAAAADTPESEALDAIDELLQVDLVRETEVPRRFRFRHPLVRRAVYEGTPSGWRLRAHERCARALAARGASAAARAHHIERSARQGDRAAVEILRTAGQQAARLAPASAARWFGSALRVLSQTAPAEERVELLRARAAALAATGNYVESHAVLLEAATAVPATAASLRASVAAACAAVERGLGRYEQAHTRLVSTLQGVPPPASVESVGLQIELTVNEFYRSRFGAMQEWAERAIDDARATGVPGLLAAALATAALAHASTGRIRTAQAFCDEATAIVDGLTDDELARRLDAAGWLAAAELYLDRYAEADAHASRVLALARSTGDGDPFFRLYQILPRVWYMRGKLAEATEFLDGAIEAVRLLGTPPALAGNLFNRSLFAVAAGDFDVALASAEEAVSVTRELAQGFVTAWAAVRLAGVLLETRQPDRAAELLLARAGGEELRLIPGVWRVYGLELLTHALLECDRPADAERVARRAEAAEAALSLPMARAWAQRAAAAVSLQLGDARLAVQQATASVLAAEAAGAPIEASVSRTLLGRALAAAGEIDPAIAELQRAAAAFDVCGAAHFRERAERELGKLGRRPHRRTRSGAAHGVGIDALTGRELQVARLVTDRMTNAQIAAELFLGQKTVETHIRNIFNKLGVADRVAVARAVEVAERAGVRPS